ncbi:cadherin-like domain-containing protein, partial [Magnetospirillum sp. UT-4]|uniref:cadherin-like domain-containing protein n=1 Tax=Magnetospirillum sp. UT-4 TaxID=2681467 RepID=UPI001571EB27
MADDRDLHNDENEHENENQNQNSNPNSAQGDLQALDDLTLLNNIGEQNMGEARLNVARGIDPNDAAFGSLATIHQGSDDGRQVQEDAAIQLGLIDTQEVIVEQAPPASVELGEVATLEDEGADAAELAEPPPAPNTLSKDDLSEANVVFGQGIESAPAPEVQEEVEERVEEVAEVTAENVVPGVIEEEVFADSQPVFGGLTIDIPDDGLPEIPLETPIKWKEDQTLSFGINAEDPDGGSVIITYTDPAHGTLNYNSVTGKYEYTPDPDYFTSYIDGEGNTVELRPKDSFTITVTDDEGNSVTKLIEVDVENAQDNSTVTITGNTGAESATGDATTVTGRIVGTDADGAVVGYEVVDGNNSGTLTVNPDGTFTYVAEDSNWSGTDTFTVKVYDELGGVTEVAVPITVTPTDDAAVSDGIVIKDGSGTGDDATTTAEMQEEGRLTFAIDAEDPDGGAVTVSSVSAGHGSIFDNGDGTYSYVPNENYFGTDTLTYVVTDEAGNQTVNTVTVTIDNVDDAARISVDGGDDATGATLATSEDNAVTGTIVASDVDGAITAVELVTGTANGDIVVNADGTFTFTPDANWHGSDSFVVRVTDAEGGVTEQTITVNVGAVDDEATIAANDVTTSEDTVLTGQLSATDADGAVTFALAATGQPEHGTITVNPDGSYTYTPDANYHGADSFTVVTTDAEGNTTEKTFTLDVG